MNSCFVLVRTHQHGIAVGARCDSRAVFRRLFLVKADAKHTFKLPVSYSPYGTCYLGRAKQSFCVWRSDQQLKKSAAFLARQQEAHATPSPRHGQYAYAQSYHLHTPAFRLMSPNRDEKAVPGWHCMRYMAVYVGKVLVIWGNGVACAYYRLLLLIVSGHTDRQIVLIHLSKRMRCNNCLGVPQPTAQYHMKSGELAHKGVLYAFFGGRGQLTRLLSGIDA